MSLDDVYEIYDSTERKWLVDNCPAIRILIQKEKSTDDKLSPVEQPDDYPECSGDPTSCPENEGYGCCKPVYKGRDHTLHLTQKAKEYLAEVPATEQPDELAHDEQWLARIEEVSKMDCWHSVLVGSDIRKLCGMIRRGQAATPEATQPQEKSEDCRQAYEAWEELYWSDKKKYPSSWDAWQEAWSWPLKKRGG